jgi:hypothetical protein
MSAVETRDPGRRLTGGLAGPLLLLGFALVAAAFLYAYYLEPWFGRSYGHDIHFNQAMFGPAIEQPIPFSHRLHATDKEIDCRYCHSYVDRSIHAGLPSVQKCLGCHNHIIPQHEEIQKLRSYQQRDHELDWTRVYYAPDHVFFPHFRHLRKDVRCQECHGEVERVDRLRKVTFYMGFCIDCHEERGATRECVACHQ